MELADTFIIWQDSSGTVCQISLSDLIASFISNTQGAQTVTPINADTVLTPEMGFVVVNSGAAITVTLPLAAASSGITFPIMNKGAGHVTIQTSGSDTVAGQSTVTLTQFQSTRLQSDGSNLFSND